jgi:hypothetical protein
VVAVHHHRVPGLDVPGQRGDGHVGPVAEQVVDGGAQCAEAGFELAVDAFWSQRSLASSTIFAGVWVGVGGDGQVVK